MAKTGVKNIKIKPPVQSAVSYFASGARASALVITHIFSKFREYIFIVLEMCRNWAKITRGSFVPGGTLFVYGTPDPVLKHWAIFKNIPSY
jgi:hypothetical protein